MEGLRQITRRALTNHRRSATCLFLTVFALSGCRTPSDAQGQFELMRPDEWFTKSASKDDGPKPPTTTGTTFGDVNVAPVPPLVRQDWAPAAPVASNDESEEEPVQHTSMWNMLGSQSFWRAKTNQTAPQGKTEPQLRPIPGSYE